MKNLRAWSDHLRPKSQTPPQQTRKATSLLVSVSVTLALTLLTIIPIYYSSLRYYPSFLWTSSVSSSSSTSSSHGHGVSAGAPSAKQCDLFTGEWVSNPDAPYYTNRTCWTIHEEQNCMKYGRPDTGFMKWRWKPNDCELPIFNPSHFLELVRGKSMAFVGDSLGRNHMESLLCLLSRVENPVEVQLQRWKFTSYNFKIAHFWAPYLIKAERANANDPSYTALFHLHLDELDPEWATKIVEFDYIIISAGHWFFRPTLFYENGQLVGCFNCYRENVTDLRFSHSYRKALQTAFRAIYSSRNFKGLTFLRTFSPQHFENGSWNQGGNCVRTRPFTSNETRLEDINLQTHSIETEEFEVAESEGRKRGLKFRLLDITFASLLRPDGHPSRYGHLAPHDNMTFVNDCAHWCLPGAIDAWNDLLLQMMKMEDGRSFDKTKSSWAFHFF